MKCSFEGDEGEGESKKKKKDRKKKKGEKEKEEPKKPSKMVSNCSTTLVMFCLGCVSHRPGFTLL